MGGAFPVPGRREITDIVCALTMAVDGTSAGFTRTEVMALTPVEAYDAWVAFSERLNDIRNKAKR